MPYIPVCTPTTNAIWVKKHDTLYKKNIATRHSEQ